MTDLLDQNDLSEKGIFIPRKAAMIYSKNSGTAENKNYISIVYSNLRPDGKRDSMVVNLDQNVLQDLVMKGSDEGTYHMLIVNDQGLVISRPYWQSIRHRRSKEKKLDSGILTGIDSSSRWPVSLLGGYNET